MRVLLPLPLPPFSFLPPVGREPITPGCRVVVPWQQGIRIGIVFAVEEGSGHTPDLREVIAPLDHTPFVTPAALRVVERLAAEACCPMGLVLATLLPTGLGEMLTHEAKAVAELDGVTLPTDRWIDADTLDPRILDHHRSQGLVQERVHITRPTVRVLRAQRPPDSSLDGARQANQRRALELLWSLEYCESAAALGRDADVPESAVRSLITKGYAAYEVIEAPPPPLPAFDGQPLEPIRVPVPPGKRLALEGGLRRDRLAALLPLIASDLRANGSVLVLVPEGALLDETASLLSGTFPVQVLSGELTDSQRSRLWHDLPNPGPSVLVASYLGILAPLPSLARVVVLEEGSPSYKLMSGPRLFVPFAAQVLADEHQVPIVFADALTTSETRHLLSAESCISLDHASRRTHVTDLAAVNNWPLSADLIKVLRQVQDRNRQAVLLAPRRGFSAALECSDCRYVAMCPNCDLPLRYHREHYRLQCHQCGHAQRLPDICPNCSSTELGPSRAPGTQWIAREVMSLLPGLKVKRFDSDHRDDLSEFMEGEPGVLVATTAILRHPPLPRVSLIGITLLDSFLNLGDFRAEEQALRLLLGLAELAPGARPLMVLQTFQPEHPVLQAYCGSDFQPFMEAVLERRRRFGYPPFCELAKVQVSARDATTAERAASWLAGALRTAGADDSELLGPTPAPVNRVKRQYSYQLFLRAAARERLQVLLRPALDYRGPARVRIDCDPRDISGFID